MRERVSLERSKAIRTSGSIQEGSAGSNKSGRQYAQEGTSRSRWNGNRPGLLSGPGRVQSGREGTGGGEE